MELASSHAANEFIQRITEALKGDLSLEERSDANEFLRHFRPILDAATKNGFKVFTVDHSENFGQGIDINVRDVAIFRNVVKHLSSQCQQAIMFVGKAHISSDEKDRVKLSDLLRASHASFISLNLQYASDPGPDELVSWNRLCGGQLLSLKDKPVIFSNDSIRKQTPLWPHYIGGSREQGLWSDFDFTILIP